MRVLQYEIRTQTILIGLFFVALLSLPMTNLVGIAIAVAFWVILGICQVAFATIWIANTGSKKHKYYLVSVILVVALFLLALGLERLRIVQELAPPILLLAPIPLAISYYIISWRQRDLQEHERLEIRQNTQIPDENSE